MRIGEVARAAGVTVKMIRHYEAQGLLPEAPRTAAGYRRYGERDVHTLAFVRRARSAGFSTPQIRRLLSLWQDGDRSSAQVKAMALEHLALVRERIEGLQAVAATLEALSQACHGDHRPDCPILDALGRDGGTVAALPKGRPRGRALRFGAL